MEAKYILLLCTAMSYLVIQSVATKSGELSLADDDYVKAVREAYNITREFYEIPLGGKLTVLQFMWLMHTDEYSIISDNLNEDRIDAMFKDNISEEELPDIIRTICVKTGKNELDFMETINKKLKDKFTGVKYFDAVTEAYNTTREFFQIPLRGKLTVKQFMWLMDTDDKNILLDNFYDDRIAEMYRDHITEYEIVFMIKTICNKTGFELLDFMKTLNQKLKDKLKDKRLNPPLSSE